MRLTIKHRPDNSVDLRFGKFNLYLERHQYDTVQLLKERCTDEMLVDLFGLSIAKIVKLHKKDLIERCRAFLAMLETKPLNAEWNEPVVWDDYLLDDICPGKGLDAKRVLKSIAKFTIEHELLEKLEDYFRDNNKVKGGLE